MSHFGILNSPEDCLKHRRKKCFRYHRSTLMNYIEYDLDFVCQANGDLFKMKLIKSLIIEKNCFPALTYPVFSFFMDSGSTISSSNSSMVHIC